MYPQDPGQAADRLDALSHDLGAKAERYQQLHERMATASVTETSPDGISVTVDSGGVPTAFGFTEAVRGMAPERLASELLACMHRAQARLAQQVQALVQETVGDDEAGNAVIEQYTTRFPDPDQPQPTSDPAADDDAHFTRDSWLR